MAPKLPPKRTTTLAKAAVELNVDRATIARWCGAGCPCDRVTLPAGGVTVFYLVDVEEVRRWRAKKPNGNTGKRRAKAVAS